MKSLICYEIIFLNKKRFLIPYTSTWSYIQPRAHQIAVLAPPGVGKTHMLARFVKWIQQPRLRHQGELQNLSPIGLFFTPNNIPDSFEPHELWSIIKALILEDGSKRDVSEKPDSSLIEFYRRAGLIFLLFDGLDEFGTQRRENLSKLMHAFEHIVGLGINVIITCRENFWKRGKITNDDKYKIIEILPPTATQAEDILGTPDGLPVTALDSNGKPKSWILNPLMLFFIKDIQENRKIWEQAGKSRSSLYRLWAEHKAERAQHRCNIFQNELLPFLQKIAFQLLKKRENCASFNELREAVSTITLAKLKGLDDFIIGVGDGKYEFIHYSLYEYFTAWALKDDFEQIINGRLRGLQLAEVELDYLPSSVYGFLSQLLNENYEGRSETYLKRLVQCLTETNAKGYPWKLTRNLVEYIGETCEGAVDNIDAIVNLMLSLINNADLDFREHNKTNCRVRYNAARALERIHPRDPMPYFDYVSDWGGRDWTNEQKIVKDFYRKEKEKYTVGEDIPISPWVMRGHRIKEPLPKRHRSFFVPNNDNLMDGSLQLHVSEELGRILKQMISSPKEYELPLWLNCSWAWVRWFHCNHENTRHDLIGMVKNIIEKKSVKNVEYTIKILENIDKWVGRW